MNQDILDILYGIGTFLQNPTMELPREQLAKSTFSLLVKKMARVLEIPDVPVEDEEEDCDEDNLLDIANFYKQLHDYMIRQVCLEAKTAYYYTHEQGDHDPEQGEQGVICSICGEENGDSSIITSYGCGHQYHESCIEKRIQYCVSENLMLQCPDCRDSESDGSSEFYKRLATLPGGLLALQSERIHDANRQLLFGYLERFVADTRRARGALHQITWIFKTLVRWGKATPPLRRAFVYIVGRFYWDVKRVAQTWQRIKHTHRE